MSKIVVLGLGNLLRCDEGVGIHALRALMTERERFPQVEWMDGGTLGLELLPRVEEASHLLVLDAVNVNQPPGTVAQLSNEEIPARLNAKLSPHQTSFSEVLALAKLRGRLPAEIVLIGAQPATLEWGMELSPPVRAALDDMVRHARAQLGEWQDSRKES